MPHDRQVESGKARSLRASINGEEKASPRLIKFVKNVDETDFDLKIYN